MTSALTSVNFAAPRIARKAPSFILLALILFVWASVWRAQDLWPVVGSIKAPLLLELILVAAFAANSSAHRQFSQARSLMFLAPFGLLAIMVVGLPLNLYRFGGFIFIEKDFLPTILLFLVVATSVREMYDLEWLAFLHVLGAAVYAFWIFRFVPIASDGRLGGLVYYDANDFGMLLDASIPFAIYFARPGAALWKRVLSVVILALFVVMLTRSGSRGGFLGFIAVMLYVLFRFRGIPARTRAAAVGLGVALLLSVGSTAYWNMMNTIAHPQDDYNLTDPIGRKAIWKRGTGYLITHPIFGVGAAAFGQAEGRISETAREFAARNQGLKWSTAHNSFVLVGAELGLGGILLFVGMLVSAIRTLNRVRAGPDGVPGITPADEAFAQTLAASLVGFIVAGFFISASYTPYLYLLMGLAVGQHVILKRRVRSLRPVGPLAPRPQAAPEPRQLHRRKPHWAPAG